MKKYILLLWLLLPAAASALSCPTNSSTIDQGDSIQEVLQRCGTPVAQNDYIRVTPVTHQWESANQDASVIYKEKVTHLNNVTVTELSYNGSRLGPNTLRFENGKLTSWE